MKDFNDHNLSHEQKDELRDKQENKAREFYKSSNSVVEMIEHTLANFGYRYFESDSFESFGVELKGDDHLEYRGRETSLVEALKCGNAETKKKLIEFAKNVDIKKKPSIEYILGSKVISLDSRGAGEIELYSEVNWDFPEFSRNSENKLTKTKRFLFDDPLVFRNEYALF